MEQLPGNAADAKLGVVAVAGQLHGPLQRLQAHADAGAADAQPAPAAGAVFRRDLRRRAWRPASSPAPTRRWTWAWRPACWPASWPATSPAWSPGVLISIPAMINGEYLTMPLLAAVGVLGGLLRDCAPDTEDIWRFSPFFDLSIYRHLQTAPRPPADGVPMFLLLAILFAEFLRADAGPPVPELGLLPPPAVGLSPPAAHRARLRDHAVRGDAAAEDLEQRPQRDQAGGAGTTAA